MKKPSKPSKPVEPQKPERVTRENQRWTFDFDGNSVQDLLDQIRAKTDLPLSDISIYISSGYYDDTETIEFSWDVQQEVIKNEHSFNLLMAKYEGAMTLYRLKLQQYEINMAQYEKDILAWEQEKQRELEEKERAQLAALQAKYGKT